MLPKKRANSGLKKAVRTSFKAHRDKLAQGYYILPELSDYLLETILKGNANKAMQAKKLEARRFKANVIKQHAEIDGYLKGKDLRYLLTNLQKGIPWAVERPEFAEIKKDMRAALREIPSLLKGIKGVDDTAHVKVTEFVYRGVSLNKAIQVARIMEFMGEKTFNAYKKALDKAANILIKTEKLEKQN